MESKNARVMALATGQHDDIRALEDAFSLNAFQYVDVSRQERLAAIVTRWPLIAELLAEQGAPCP